MIHDFGQNYLEKNDYSLGQNYVSIKSKPDFPPPRANPWGIF